MREQLYAAGYLLNRRLIGSQSRLGHSERAKNLTTLPGLENSLVVTVCSLVTTAIMLLRLQIVAIK